MILDELYTKELNKYLKNSMTKIMKETVEIHYQISFYLSILTCGISFCLTITMMWTSETTLQLNLLLPIVIMLTFTIFLYKYYKQELDRQFRKKYALCQKKINYRDIYSYSKILDNIEFQDNIEHLIEYANIKIEISARTFFHNPIAILLISFIMSISVNLITHDTVRNINFIFGSYLFASIFLYVIFVLHMGSGYFRNKDLAFKSFLKQVEYKLMQRKNCKI